MRFVGPIFVLLSLALLLWAFNNQQSSEFGSNAIVPRLALDQAAAPVVGNVPAADSSVRVVNLFASWCTPCIAELPYLKQLRAQSGVPLIGIAYHDKAQMLMPWLQKHGNPFDAVYLDSKGLLLGSLTINGVPETLVIAPDNRVLFRHSGVVTAQELNELLAAIQDAK
jgi:cytochrome c biogenesis protein CcmG/thiol:disulfide interchange protein DsbE